MDAEICVELGGDIDPSGDVESVRAAVAGAWPALEVVDLAPRPGEPESVVAGNIFHRAVAFGASAIPLECSDEMITTYVNDEPSERGGWPGDLPERLLSAARILAAVGEGMRAGDRIITGSITQVAVGRGDHVRADFAGTVGIALSVGVPPSRRTTCSSPR